MQTDQPTKTPNRTLPVAERGQGEHRAAPVPRPLGVPQLWDPGAGPSLLPTCPGRVALPPPATSGGENPRLPVVRSGLHHENKENSGDSGWIAAQASSKSSRSSTSATPREKERGSVSWNLSAAWGHRAQGLRTSAISERGCGVCMGATQNWECTKSQAAKASLSLSSPCSLEGVLGARPRGMSVSRTAS